MTNNALKNSIETKFYKHYKNKRYKYIGVAKHSEELVDYVIYECLYPNETAQLWIRPAKMFHEFGSFGDKLRPRFKKIDFHVKAYTTITDDLKKIIFPLCKAVFKEFCADKFQARLENKDNILLLCAFDENQLVGFKLGYQRDILRYYSWLGAVAEEYRGLGVAQLLMHEQHQWAKQNKYKFVETKSENKFKSMISLNLFSGFEVTGTENSSTGQFKILFCKNL